MLKCLIALTSLLSAAALAAPAWTWVDAQGRRHYSDRPVEGATQIELGTTQTFSSSAPRPAARPSAAAGTESGAPPAAAYSVLDKTSTWRDFALEGVHWRSQLRAMLADLKEQANG